MKICKRCYNEYLPGAGCPCRKEAKEPAKRPSGATDCSGFFIVNDHDRPWAVSLAERREDGKFYYAHPMLRDDKRYHGMTPTSPTPIEAFGIRIALMDGMLYGATDPRLPVTASYSDGRPRKWQGGRSFEFRFQNADVEARR
jgi:hypothetical protein